MTALIMGRFLACLLATSLTLVVVSNAELQVIGTGSGRTGSTSLHEALNMLGYKTHHLFEIFKGKAQHPSHLDFWMDAFANGCNDTETLREMFERGEYTASVHPIHYPCLEAMIFELYPNAKVIHTQRTDAELWHDSTANSICDKGRFSVALKLLLRLRPIFRKYERFRPTLMGHVLFGEGAPVQGINREYCLSHKEQMIAQYNAHNARIKAMVPADRLLVITNHDKGWGPLCEFLGKPVPNEPFPHVNDRESMRQSVSSIAVKAVAKYPVISASLAVRIGLLLCLVLGRKKSKILASKKED